LPDGECQVIFFTFPPILLLSPPKKDSGDQESSSLFNIDIPSKITVINDFFMPLQAVCDKIRTMNKKDSPFVSFLKEVLRRRQLKPSQLAADLRISHATVSRWLSGGDIPKTSSCQRLADYSGVPVQKILAITGHLPGVSERPAAEWPEFREYAQHKYPAELDEDLITMIEDLIERRRIKKYGEKDS
jgi:transcriptional regulator with XRE-family HTH domain